MTQPNEYPLDVGLKDVTATIYVLDATPTPDSRNSAGYQRWTNSNHQAARVMGSGTVNRIAVTFDIGLEWRAKWDAEAEKHDHRQRELTWSGYSNVRRAVTRDDAPDGARSKINQAVSKAAMAFLTDNPQAVHLGRLIALQDVAKRKESDVQELRAKLDAATQALTVANAIVEAWEAGKPLTYAVNVYESSGGWGNRREFERSYKIEAPTAYAAAMAGFERAEKEVPPGEHDRRTATAEPLISGAK